MQTFLRPKSFYLSRVCVSVEFSGRIHAEAAVYMMIDHADNPDFPDHFTYIPYNKEKVNQKLDYITDRLFKEKYLDCKSSTFPLPYASTESFRVTLGCEAGQPVSNDSPFWWAQTKSHLTTYLIQRESYHLTDGTWLRGVPQGPMSPIQAKLFAIYIDETVNGDVEQNHCNVYMDVLRSLCLVVPPITSREFVDQQAILEISFKKPLLTLTTSLFPKTFEPEILGYTLVRLSLWSQSSLTIVLLVVGNDLHIGTCRPSKDLRTLWVKFEVFSASRSDR